MKDLADEYQRTAKLNQNIKSLGPLQCSYTFTEFQMFIFLLEDIKKFVSSFPEFKKLSGNVAKHWSLMEELQRQVCLSLTITAIFSLRIYI